MDLKEDINRLLVNFKGIEIEGRKPYGIIKEMKDFSNLPILDKTILQKIISEIGKCPEKPVITHTTSGSTNIPLTIYFSKESWKNIIQRTIKSYMFAGVEKNDIILNLFGYGTFVAGPIYDEAAKNLGNTLLPLGASNMTDRERLIKIIKNACPDVICGVPSYVLEISKLMKEEKIKLPKKVLCAGESLNRDYRNEFENLGIKAYDNYGCTEIPAMAAEADEKEWMCLIEDGLYFEFLDDSNNPIEKGEGKLVVTDLFNYSTPIIRYKLGDRILMKKKNGKRYIKIIRRDDNLRKYRGVFVNIDTLCEEAKKYSKNFFMEMEINKESMKDELKIYLPLELSTKNIEIIDNFRQKFRIKPSIIFTKDIPIFRTSSGKIKHFVDKRA